MRQLLWVLPFVPAIGAAFAYVAASKRWHRACLLIFSLLANSQILWIAAIATAYCYSRDWLIAPFATALVSSVLTGPVLYASTRRFRTDRANAPAR